MITVTPVSLRSGSAIRLWPLSCTGFPKQFLYLTGKENLLWQADLRLANLGNTNIQVAAPLTVTGEDHRYLVSEQFREIGAELSYALLGPTDPALTLAALAAMDGGTDPVLVVMPADQTVVNAAAFTAAMQQAAAQAANDTIAILGVTPDKPDTGYCYIQAAESLQGKAEAIQLVQCFVENPDANIAEAYLNEGSYYWNVGMFVRKASVWLKTLEQFCPDILQATQAACGNSSADSNFFHSCKAEFTAIPSESVDYAAMERCLGSSFTIGIVPLDAGWNNLGAWCAVWNVLPKDVVDNAHAGDVPITNSKKTLVHPTSQLVCPVGVENVIVVEITDAVLVAEKTRSKDVKKIVSQLQKIKKEVHVLHRKVHHPRGWYDSIDNSHRFKVKRIEVKPKASLSLKDTITDQSIGSRSRVSPWSLMAVKLPYSPRIGRHTPHWAKSTGLRTLLPVRLKSLRRSQGDI